jgi:predicted DNA-binding ribbon-helix-helix protein
MKSSVVKRSIVIVGHKTSVSLEDPFWDHLKSIARAQRMTLSELVAGIDGARMFVLEHLQNEHKRVDVTEAHRTSVSAEGSHDSGL